MDTRLLANSAQNRTMPQDAEEAYEAGIIAIVKSLLIDVGKKARCRSEIRRSLFLPYEVAQDISFVADTLFAQHGYDSTILLPPENAIGLAAMWGLAGNGFETRVVGSGEEAELYASWRTTGGGKVAYGRQIEKWEVRGWSDRMELWKNDKASFEAFINGPSGTWKPVEPVGAFVPPAAQTLGIAGIDLYTKQRESGTTPRAAALSVGEILGKQGEIAAGMQGWNYEVVARKKETGRGY